ncbi:hypothetical protein POSPLADRAFT_1062468 [Postia placenta MAD-698-R-SB12]|uniref:Uncharacterized protein n=1 Tax=Postia placenta MAD-698-R-SB12 TaxID=670580 RepID=A0A1X6MJT9_9APHY|nr:hypothetical protein POSPLADRAFT_1062468 [Postia placenta MAD-698-R-SB12]OSX56640.1 hypothetical protein POSPLADRAFT_1062468 [Postia placenta MAD-698-R-SB12]
MSLRLALGSIVAPKRPTRAMSNSGTASPVFPYGTPVTPLPTPATPASQSSSSSPDRHEQSPTSHSHSPLAFATTAEPDLPPAVTIVSDSARTSRAKLIGTLQSKSAFDALVHGSWV